MARSLDGCDFRAETVWRTEAPRGRLHLLEAASLDGIPDDAYDFVLASHVLEHLASPLRALRTWRRVTRPGGALVLVVPEGAGTFDHRRPVTEFAHLVEDLERGTGEDDLTHLEEILQLHDLERDPDAGSREAFEARSRANAEHRCLHHHVFDAALVTRCLAYAGWKELDREVLPPFHVAALAECPRPGLGS